MRPRDVGSRHLLGMFSVDVADARRLQRRGYVNQAEALLTDARTRVMAKLARRWGLARTMRHAAKIQRALDGVQHADDFARSA